MDNTDDFMDYESYSELSGDDANMNDADNFVTYAYSDPVAQDDTDMKVGNESADAADILLDNAISALEMDKSNGDHRTADEAENESEDGTNSDDTDSQFTDPTPDPDAKLPNPWGETDFLATEFMWRFRLGEDWEPKQVFSGGYATCGYFTRDISAYSPGAHAHTHSKHSPLHPNALTGILVKQVDARGEGDWQLVSKGLKREFEAYKLLNKARSESIVRMYRRLHHDISYNYHRDDPWTDGDDGGQVERIYLEYCPGGTMWTILDTMLVKDMRFEEEDVWWIFRCLARGVSVCARGTDKVDGEEWEHEIVHRDLHAGNVFIGCFDDEKARMPVFKLGDFGLADDVLKYPSSTPYEASADGLSKPPEQVGGPEFGFPLRKPRLGSPANVWQVGALMYRTILGGERWDPKEPEQIPCHLNEKLRKLSDEVVAERFHTAEIFSGNNNVIRLYSPDLRALIVECLLREPTERPTAKELLRRAEDGYKRWKGKSKNPPHDFDEFKDIPRRCLGHIPPPEWRIVDDSAINIIVTCYRTPDDSLHILIRDIPYTMKIYQLAWQLERQLFGKPWRQGKDLRDITPDEWQWTADDQRWVWKAELLSDFDTVGSLGLQNMDRLVVIPPKIRCMKSVWKGFRSVLKKRAAAEEKFKT